MLEEATRFIPMPMLSEIAAGLSDVDSALRGDESMALSPASTSLPAESPGLGKRDAAFAYRFGDAGITEGDIAGVDGFEPGSDVKPPKITK